MFEFLSFCFVFRRFDDFLFLSDVVVLRLE